MNTSKSSDTHTPTECSTDHQVGFWGGERIGPGQLWKKWCPKSGHMSLTVTHTHTHRRLMALFPGLPGWAGTRQVKPIWILLKQETVSGSGISWVECKFAPCSRQITMPAPQHSVFYRLDALPVAQPMASKHWRHYDPYDPYCDTEV